jgi:hypothetical protein
MIALCLSGTIFMLTLGGILLGTLLRRALPSHHLNDQTKDVVKDCVRLIATISALVLGLLIGAARGSFDTQSTQVKQITANLILLDNTLGQYGADARPIREDMRSAVGPFADRLWREKKAKAIGPFEASAAEEQIFSDIQKLSPHNEVQRSLQSRALQIGNDIAQARFMLFAETDNLIPIPFLAILAVWLVIVFASYSLFSPLNATLFACLAVFAFSTASAIFLVLELSRPFTGLMMLSSVPLRNALGAI